MVYGSEDFKAYLEKVISIGNLDWVKNHLSLKEKPNFWTILEYGEERGTQSKSAHETRSSRMIRWLMDPNETHGLGNIFAYKLMEQIGLKYNYSPKSNQHITATAEYMDIDTFYKDLSQKMCIAIELKQFAKEGKSTGYDSQLDKYEDLISQEIKENKEDVTPYYIFLTPLKEQPSNEKWYPLGYQELIDIIEQVYTEKIRDSKAQYIEDTKKIMLDFKDDLQRSLDFLKKDNSFIMDTLTEKEKQLTLKIAEEIEHGENSNYLENLMAINYNEDLNVKDIILIMKDYISVQKHTPNTGVRMLMRKIYNYLSSAEDINTDPEVEDKVKSIATPIKEQLIKKYNLNYNSVQLTRGKGQGMYLYHTDGEHRIYLSGDTYGNFPNDGIQLLSIPNKNIVRKSSCVSNSQFHVDDAIIQEDKIQDKKEEITLNQLIESYIMEAIMELNN